MSSGREYDAEQRDSAHENERERGDLAGEVPSRPFAFGGDAPRERGHEGGRERALGKQIAQHVGRAKCRQERVHVPAGAEHGGENDLANQPQNAAAKNCDADHTGRAGADSLGSRRQSHVGEQRTVSTDARKEKTS